jgi:hypothetical protein
MHLIQAYMQTIIPLIKLHLMFCVKMLFTMFIGAVTPEIIFKNDNDYQHDY